MVVPHLEGGVLANAEGVRCVACDGLFAEDVLGALHDSRLAHALERVGACGGLLCRQEGRQQWSSSPMCSSETQQCTPGNSSTSQLVDFWQWQPGAWVQQLTPLQAPSLGKRS